MILVKTNLGSVNLPRRTVDNSGDNRTELGDIEVLAQRRPRWWRVLVYLRQSYHRSGITPGLRELVLGTGVSQTAVSYALHNLAALGYLRAVERSGATQYVPAGPTPGELIAENERLRAELTALRLANRMISYDIEALQTFS